MNNFPYVVLAAVCVVVVFGALLIALDRDFNRTHECIHYGEVVHFPNRHVEECDAWRIK